MNKSPAFQFYPDDHLSDPNIHLLTNEELGAYFKLLCFAWKSSEVGCLTNDDKYLARLTGLGDEKWKDAKDNILRCFGITEKQIIQKRLVREFEKQQGYREEQSEKANKRWAEHRKKQLEASEQPQNTQAHAELMPVHSQSNALQSSSPSPSSSPELVEEKNKIKNNSRGESERGTAAPAKPSRPDKIKKSESRGSPVPKNFEVTDELKVWGDDLAIQQGVDPPNWALQVGKFVDHHTANGTLFKDWTAGWRKWARNAIEFSKTKPGVKHGTNSGPTKDEQRHAKNMQALIELNRESGIDYKPGNLFSGDRASFGLLPDVGDGQGQDENLDVVVE